MMPRTPQTVVLAVTLAILCFAGMSATARMNKYETKVLKESISERFSQLIQMWKEELYFEMYDFGQVRSRAILSKAEFAQRMVDLQWKPALTEIKLETIRILYRNFVAVHCIIEFENKVNLAQKVTKRMIFPTILEKNGWKFDLLQFIRIPFGGTEYIQNGQSEEKSPKTAPKSSASPSPSLDSDSPSPAAAQ